MNILLTTASATENYGMALLQSFFALVAVCLLAWLALRLLSRLGMGNRRVDSVLRIVDRLPLDARRSVVLVRAGERYFLIGVGDGSAPTLISELQGKFEPDAPTVASPTQSFRQMIENLRSRPPGRSPDEEGS